jgi:hypothetical protein
VTAPRIELCRSAELPAGAWCLTLQRGAGVALVEHGLAVEAIGAGFVEGVWSAPFGDGDFIGAQTRAGTGATVVGDELVLTAGSALARGINHVVIGDRWFASNSWPFLLARTGLRPTIGRRDYFHVRGLQVARPTSPPPVRFTGGAVELEVSRPLAIDRLLRVRRLPPTPAPAFTGFAEYRDLVVAELAALADNARSGSRRHPLRLEATISAGYDSAASAVLGYDAGWRDAVTLAHGAEDPDSGAAIGHAVGYDVETVGADAWETAGPFPEAEFLVSGGPAMPVRIAGAARALSGAVVLGGAWGDRYWHRHPSWLGPGLDRPGEGSGGLTGYAEMELRLGSVMVAVPAIGVTDPATLFRLSNDAAMASWQVGGDYDRPIPRRILEDAGIDRLAFAVNKAHGAAARLSPATRAHYREWLAAHGGGNRRRASNLVGSSVMRAGRQLKRHHVDGRAPGWLVDRLSYNHVLPWDTGHLYHWAVEQTVPRYKRVAAPVW